VGCILAVLCCCPETWVLLVVVDGTSVVATAFAEVFGDGKVAMKG
jgi:hypothetical protein